MEAKTKKRGFTLAEVLVVAAIIGILATITMSVYGNARSRALGTSSVSNMRQIGTALLLYANDHDDFLPPLANQEMVIWAIEHWPHYGVAMQLPTNSDMPERIRVAVHPYIHDDAIWFSPLDMVRRQDVFYLGIRHELTSYIFDLVDWRDYAGRRPGFFPAHMVSRMQADDYLVCEPVGWPELIYNEPNLIWEGPCRSYYKDGTAHKIANDLHVIRANCNDKTRVGGR